MFLVLGVKRKMVEPLKKEDIVIPIKLDIFSNKEYIEVSRIKEVIGLAESLINEKRAEDKRLRGGISRATAIQVFRECFGVLFDSQSPKSRVCDLADNRTPSQEIRHEFQSAENPVGVSSFCQKCGHEKEKHHFFENGKPLKKCMGVFNISFCDCSGFVEDKK